MTEWIGGADWVDFLARDPATRSCTAICLAVVDPGFAGLGEAAQREVIAALVKRLEDEEVAFDLAGYREAPPGLRIWGGATVECEDIEALLPWLDWAFSEVRG